MVHALYEAHRVLKPNGVLLDLRPTATHRRVGLGKGASWESVGVMRERFDDDHAADHAVAQVLRDGLYKRQSQTRFDLDRVMDTMEDFRTWLNEFVQMGNLASHESLIKRVEAAKNKQRAQTKITVRGPLKLGVMKKIEKLIS